MQDQTMTKINVSADTNSDHQRIITEVTVRYKNSKNAIQINSLGQTLGTRVS